MSVVFQPKTYSINNPLARLGVSKNDPLIFPTLSCLDEEIKMSRTLRVTSEVSIPRPSHLPMSLE